VERPGFVVPARFPYGGANANLLGVSKIADSVHVINDLVSVIDKLLGLFQIFAAFLE
jgi:hypothetical protein